jgi:hypothetical protein
MSEEKKVVNPYYVPPGDSIKPRPPTQLELDQLRLDRKAKDAEERRNWAWDEVVELYFDRFTELDWEDD